MHTTRFSPFQHVRLISMLAHYPERTVGLLDRLWGLLNKARPTPAEAEALGYAEAVGPDGRFGYRWRADAAEPIVRRWTEEEARLLAAIVRQPPEAVPWLTAQKALRDDMLRQLGAPVESAARAEDHVTATEYPPSECETTLSRRDDDAGPTEPPF